MWPAVPLLVEFIAGSRLEREPEHAPRSSAFPILGNGPPGTFVCFEDGRRVPLPTDQIVFGEDGSGAARVGFGGMRFDGLVGSLLQFKRVRELRPLHELSPERRTRMTLELELVEVIVVDGRLAWPPTN